MTAMAQNTDKGAVFEWSGVAARTDKHRVNRYRMREAAVNRVAGAPLRLEAAGLNEAVTVASVAIFEIDSVDHAVAVHRIGVVDRLEKWIGTVAHISATEVSRNAARDKRQVGGIDFSSDWQIVAAQVRIVRGPVDVPSFRGFRERFANAQANRCSG